MRVGISRTLFILVLINVKFNHAANDAKECQCVSMFLCQDDTEDDLDGGNINLRPMRSVVVRKKDDCNSALEICCEPEKIISETKQMSSTGCGIRNFYGINPRITSDSNHETKFGEFPWTIAVLHNRQDNQDEYICDGTLIHRKVVLTAAHCVDGKTADRIKIRAGEWDTQTIDEILPHQDRAVETILIHENYSPRLFHNDFALLILSRSLKITKNVNVVCLPESINEVETTQCLVSGWSRNHLDGSYDSVLKQLNLQMIPRTFCQRTLRQSGLGKNFLLDKSFICGVDKLENNMWKGDGGSPFVCPLKIDGNRFVQIGIMAQNIGRSMRTTNIFADVLHARTWIDEQLLFHNLDNTEYQYGNSAYENYIFK